MRLVDADDMHPDSDASLSCYYGSNCRIDDVQDYIDAQPTIDAEPVRHGRWSKAYRSGYVPTDGKPICSECDCWNGGKSDYCPHCGAKMDAPSDAANID